MKSSVENLDPFLEEIPFRGLEYEELITSFRGVLTHPGEANARVILIGPPGSGKSFVLNYFQSKIQTGRIVNTELDITLHCINIDCQKIESSKKLVFELIKDIDPNSQASLEECHTAELQYILADLLIEKKVALIIIFDNIDFLVNIEPEEVNSLIYGFQRFSEGKSKDEPHLFSQILVAHDLNFLAELDRSVFRKVTTDVIPFEPYTFEQTFQTIANYTKENQIKRMSEKTIWLISFIAKGNMRLALELIDRANTITQQNHQLTISPENIRLANQELTDFKITENFINELPLGEKLLLLTIARHLKNSSNAFLNFLDLPGLFFGICEEYDSLTLAKFFSDVFDHLERLALISLTNINKSVVIVLSDISAQELTAYLESILKYIRRDLSSFT